MRKTHVSRRTKLTAVIGAVVVFLTAVGTAPAVAAWTAAGTATSTASTPTVAITQTGFSGLTATYLNSTLTSTGSFTVTNTGTGAGTATVAVSTTGSLAAALPIQVWPVANAAACTTATAVPGNAASGTWAAFPALAPASLAPSATATYCVRTTIADRDAVATASGAQSATPTFSATMAVGGWTASATATAVTQQTQWMYPRASGYLVSGAGSNWFAIKGGADGRCMDVAQSSNTAGAVVQAYSCNNSGAQRFDIVPVPGNPTLVTLRAKSSGLLNVAVSGGKTVLATANASAPEQQWRLDQSSPTTYQLVSAQTGLCFTTTGTNAQSGVAACAGSTVQSLTIARDAFSCSVNGTNLTINFTTSSNPRTYTVQYRLGQAAWSNAGTVATNVTAVTLAKTAFASTGTLDVQVIDEAGAVVYGGMTAVTTATTIACGTGWL